MRCLGRANVSDLLINPATIAGHSHELNEDCTTTQEIHEEEPLRKFAVVVDRVDDDNTDDDNDNVNDYDDDNDDDGAKDE